MTAGTHAHVTAWRVGEGRKRGRARRFVVFVVEVIASPSSSPQPAAGPAAGLTPPPPRADGQRWVVFRRFSEFHRLGQLLARAHPRVHLPPVPPKSIRLGSRKFRADFLEARLAKLDAYLKDVLGALRVSRAPVLDAFLLFSEHVVLHAALADTGDPGFGWAARGAPSAGGAHGPDSLRAFDEALSAADRVHRLSYDSEASSDEEDGPDAASTAAGGGGAGGEEEAVAEARAREATAPPGATLLSVPAAEAAQEMAASGATQDSLLRLLSTAEMLRWAGSRGPAWQDRAAALPAAGPARPPANDLHRAMADAVVGLREMLERGRSSLEDADARVAAEERKNAFLREEAAARWTQLEAVRMQIAALRRGHADARAQQEGEARAARQRKGALVREVKARRAARDSLRSLRGEMEGRHAEILAGLERGRAEAAAEAAAALAEADLAGEGAGVASAWRQRISECGADGARPGRSRGRRGDGDGVVDAGPDFERAQRTLLAIGERARARALAVGAGAGSDGEAAPAPAEAERLLFALVAENARLQGEANALRADLAAWGP